MRKPLSHSCVVCCLVVLIAASPLFASFGSSSLQASKDDAQNGTLLRLDWGIVRLVYLPIPLPAPVVNIFNDGPDPVESSEKDTDDVSDDENEDDNSGGRTSPFDSSGTGTTSGTRD